MSLKIAVISDTHYSSKSNGDAGSRHTAIADTLLLRAVHRLNRFIKPDLVILLGDLIDNGSGKKSQVERWRIMEIISKLDCRVAVIPGNHDGDIGQFYSVFPNPGEQFDVNGVRFVVFNDPEEPHYNASRTKADLQRMHAARSNYNGPLVALQHVPLFKPGTSESPYSYLNAGEIWDAFEKNNYMLSISGHWHPGDDQVARNAGRSIIAPALCEGSFPFIEINIDGERIETRRHELQMPRELQLVDYHVHSQYAYCSENMEMSKALHLSREMGLAGMAFTEHSGQLYYDAETFWHAGFMENGIGTVEGASNRMQNYLSAIKAVSPPAYVGLEIDCDYNGNPVVKPEDFEHIQIKVGTIHWIEELFKPEPDMDKACEEMLGRLAKFFGCGIQALAHPFRVFRNRGASISPELTAELVALLKANNVAAEINFHTQETDAEFVKACVESGVKLTFGSDSHNLYEVGEFYPHLELLKECGYGHSDLPEILADLRL
jgi:histidinol phosphatase-like PHP family hydrolase/calcineurin-like phosphoesterase family protein